MISADLNIWGKRISVEGDGSNEPSGNLALGKEFIKSNIIEGNQAVYIIHGSSS